MSTPTSELAAVDPSTGEELDRHPATDPADVPGLVAAAQRAFADPALADAARRAAALREAASALRAAGDELRARFVAESGLPAPRAAGELERTCVQLELFAGVVERGEHLEAVIDPADPDFAPVPRPDLRRMLVPLGPVVVFGASNFPFAFGVAGGDTASALAAGCPVIAKGHPSQPGVNALVGDLVAGAVARAGLPEGTFQTVQGAAQELGEALVDADGVAAVGFTGSTRAGRALFDRAARRARPIPVYAEMGSTNPAAITRAALAARGAAIREQLVTAVTGAGGQLCTKPGVVLVPDGPDGDAFAQGLARDLDDAPAPVLLNARLAEGLHDGLGRMLGEPGTQELTSGAGLEGPGARHRPAAVSVRAEALTHDAELREELFGPAVVLARYADEDELRAALAAFEGQLAAAVFAEPDADAALIGDLTRVLSARVGRLVFDGYPTGVAVTWAMQHGGPYPATTSPDHTSVGLTSTRRWMRPVSWQSAPAAALPPELRDENPTSIWRRVDGHLHNGPIGG